MQTIVVNGTLPGTLLVSSDDGPTLIQNADINNTIYLSDDGSFGPNDTESVVPLSPQSFLVVAGDRDVYGVCSTGKTANVYRVPGGMSFFQSGITGVQFQINRFGAFFYSGTPALGNLVESIAASAGTDSFGNPFLSGFTNYNPVTGNKVQIESSRIFLIPSGAPAAAAVALASVFSGTDALQFTAPDPDGLHTQALLAVVSTTNGYGVIQAANSVLQLLTSESPLTPANGSYLYVDAAAQPNYINHNGLALGLSGAKLADTSSITVTQAVATDITAAFSIPANDMKVGATYKLTTFGNGTWGSTAQVLNFAGKLGATSFLTPQWGAGTFAAGAAFRWKTETTVICTSTGAGGTFFAEMTLWISLNNVTWLPQGTNANGTGAGTVSGQNNAVNTTIANNFTTQAFWASTTGAPTLTSHGSIFQRVA